VIGMKNSKRD